MSAIDITTCECTPCRECGGEGETYTRIVTGYTKGGLPIEKEHANRCDECNGTGKDSEDCGVHGREMEPRVYAHELRAFDPKYGITAAVLGMEDEVCPACNAGDHEMPAMRKCVCACHGERRAA